MDSSRTIYKETEKEILRLETERVRLEEEINKCKEELEKSSDDVLRLEQFSNLVENVESLVEKGTSYQKDVISRYIFSNIHIGDNKVTSCSLKPPFDTLLKDPTVTTSRGRKNRTFAA